MKKIIIKDLKLLLKLLLAMTCTSAIMSVAYYIIHFLGDAIFAIQCSIDGGYASLNSLFATTEQIFLVMLAASTPFCVLALVALSIVWIFRDRG